MIGNYLKIPKISPGAYIFQRPFLRGLFVEGLIYGGKFAFQNRLGQPYSWKEICRFCFVLLCIGGQFSKYKPPGAYIWRGDLTEGWGGGGLIFGGAYTWRGLFSEFYGILSLYYGARKQQDQRNQSLYRGTTVPTII